MVMPSIANGGTLVPSHPLTLINPTPPVDKHSPTPPNRFIMFGKEWLDMQTFVARTLALPISTGDFNAKYGTFADKDQVKNVVAALKKVQNLSVTFGNPNTLRHKIQHDPHYILSPEPPAEIYSHIVWLSLQIHNAASTFNNTIMALKDILDPGTVPNKQERADNLRLILVGEGGLVSTAQEMEEKTNALIMKIGDFEQKFDEAYGVLYQFTGQSSVILADANQAVGRLDSEIKKNKEAADDAYDKFIAYTIAAVATAVAVTVLTGGLLFFVGLGIAGALGVAAYKQKSAYNSFMDQVHQEEAEKAKKVRLVTDLTSLHNIMPNVSGSMATFKTHLDQIQGVWMDTAGNLNYIAENYTVDQLSNFTWLMQAIKIVDATKKWKAIEVTTSQFTQNSLVSFNQDVKFGQLIP